MKVLLISKIEKNKTSERLNLGFLRKLPFNDYQEIKLFRQKEKKLIRTKDEIKELKPDIIINNSHNPVLDNFFKDFNCLKVQIAVDSWKIFRDSRESFYDQFDLIVNRRYFKEYPLNKPNFWLPFSANNKEFQPNKKFDKRINQVLFIGTYNSKPYIQRRKAIENLNELVDNKGRILDKKYPKLLRKYKMFLNSNELDSPYGKLFESIASGTVLLTPKLSCMNKILPEKCYIEYKDDCSNIYKQAQKALENNELLKEYSEKSREIFEQIHTDNIRINQLYENIMRFYNGKELKQYF